MKKIKILALFLALITAGVLFWYLSQDKAEAVEVPKSIVAVAACDIAENTVITSDMITTSYMPAELVLPQAYASAANIVGKTARSPIVAGEQIVSARLVEVGSSNSGSLAYTVTPGMRAITIGVNDTTGLKCMIHPGDIVDIIAHYQAEETTVTAEGEKETQPVPEARILLQQMLVLAVDQVMQESGEAAYTTLTLEATPEQAVLLSLSETVGMLRAVLRSPLDTEAVPDSRVTIMDLTDPDAKD